MKLVLDVLPSASQASLPTPPWFSVLGALCVGGMMVTYHLREQVGQEFSIMVGFREKDHQRL